MRRSICILLAFLTVATIIPLAACGGFQTPVSGNQGASSDNQGASSGNQGASSGNQSSSDGSQDAIIGVWVMENNPDYTLAGEDISYYDTWVFKPTGMIIAGDQFDSSSGMLVCDSMHAGSWEKQGNGYHIKVYFSKVDWIGTGSITASGAIQKLTLTLNDGKSVIFTRND